MESKVVFLSETQTFLALLHDCDKIKLSLSPCCNSIDKHLYIFFRKQMFSSLKWMNLSSQISSQVLMKLKRNSQVMPSEISHLSLSQSESSDTDTQMTAHKTKRSLVMINC